MYAPGVFLLWLQCTAGIKVSAVGGGGIRVLLYAIAGGWCKVSRGVVELTAGAE